MHTCTDVIHANSGPYAIDVETLVAPLFKFGLINEISYFSYGVPLNTNVSFNCSSGLDRGIFGAGDRHFSPQQGQSHPGVDNHITAYELQRVLGAMGECICVYFGSLLVY